MATSALNSSTQTQAAAGNVLAPARPAKKELDQSDFLNLLTTQMQYQDPLKPMDNQELTAQMTSFSSLNQLVSIGQKLDAVQQQQWTLSQLQATSLVGKDVSMAGNGLQLGTDGKAQATVQLAADAGRVSVRIVDKSGHTVRTIEAGGLKAGERKIAWDGKDDKGNPAPQGEYTVEVNAFSQSGAKIDALPVIRGVVSSVDLSGDAVSVTVNGIQFPLSSLLSVHPGV